MDDTWISVIDVANRHGKRKSVIFKILKRLGIEPTKRRCGTGSQTASDIGRF